MYPPARPAQLEDHLRRQATILKNCEAPVLITFDAVRPVLRMLKGLAPALAQITTPQDLAGAAPAPAGAADPEDLALLQYTSGSTGDPKGVMLSHANLLANIRAWGTAVQVSSTDVCVSWLPLYHDMGLIGAWLGSLYHACPLVLMSPLDFLAHPERWLRAIHRHRGTVTAAPNFAFELCLKRLPDMDLDGLDLSSWRFAANGAEPVSPDALERFAAAFGRYGLRREILTPVYGLAECAVGLAVPPPGRGLRIDRIEREVFMTQGRARPASQDAAQVLRFVSCGPPLPGHEVRIVDATGEALPERSVGVLEFRGPSATAGYYRNPEATRRLFRDGWLDSGDYAYLADGEIYITGRCKDMIIRAGRNFYPYDLEQAVGELPGVRKGCVAAFGVTDAGSASERLVVVAETREQDAASRGELERRIISVAAELLGLPPDVVVLAPPHSVLKTSSGKIRRAATRERYLGGALGEATRAPWLQIARLAASSLAGRSRAVAASVAGRLHAAWTWAWFGALVPVAALAILLLPQFAQRWRACHLLARLFGRISGYRLTVEGLDRLPDGPCVIVANHASYIDGIVLVAALPRPMAFVGKVELRGNKLLRILLERMAVQFVERFESRRSVEDADALVAVAAQHAPLLFFAEGTFTRWPGLRPFRLGAFQAAARAGLPVVPVSLCGTRDVLRDGSWRPRRGPLSVTVSEPVPPEGEGWHGMLALRDRVRDAILEHCGEPSLDDHRVVAASREPQAPSGSSGKAAR
jgi:1-acyl-sn-glycerol-3-phosphate acyltransferase